jgi:hypothetical protein
MDKAEYLQRSREFCRRGEECTHAKLTASAVADIRAAARQREELRAHINEHLTNKALAKKFGVSVRAIEDVISYESWRQEE